MATLLPAGSRDTSDGAPPGFASGTVLQLSPYTDCSSGTPTGSEDVTQASAVEPSSSATRSCWSICPDRINTSTAPRPRTGTAIIATIKALRPRERSASRRAIRRGTRHPEVIVTEPPNGPPGAPPARRVDPPGRPRARHAGTRPDPPTLRGAPRG